MGPSSAPPAVFTTDVTPPFGGSEPLTSSAALNAIQAGTEGTAMAIEVDLSSAHAEMLAEPPASAHDGGDTGLQGRRRRSDGCRLGQRSYEGERTGRI